MSLYEQYSAEPGQALTKREPCKWFTSAGSYWHLVFWLSSYGLIFLERVDTTIELIIHKNFSLNSNIF